MEKEIVNRVAKSPIITFNLEDLYQEGKRFQLNIAQFLHEGLILIEKNYRQQLKDLDWSIYKDGFVRLYCSTDAIVPAWAYMLISTYLNPIAKKVMVGTSENLENILFSESIAKINTDEYLYRPVIIKGCSEKPVPESAYLLLIEKLQPVVKSLMFGEACSAVPLFKQKP
jgi:hypothetical protein